MSALVFDGRVSLNKDVDVDMNKIYGGIAAVRKKAKELGSDLNEKTKPENYYAEKPGPSVVTPAKPGMDAKPSTEEVAQEAVVEEAPQEPVVEEVAQEPVVEEAPAEEPAAEETPAEESNDTGVRYCGQCGTKLGPESKFCPTCGNQVR